MLDLYSDRHTYVNTMEINYIKNCIASGSSSIKPETEILHVPESKTPRYNYTTTNGTQRIHDSSQKESVNDRASAPERLRALNVNGIGSVLKKLSIFENIKSFNYDAPAADITKARGNAVADKMLKNETETASSSPEFTMAGTLTQKYVITIIVH